ncbi:E3 ubiquitin-protein ligase TRIM21-like [Eucyclogobius newberryi]|uniref:E3 ubiquitin-protein ligase TRIM21-like n=1 Tax=Eucyclogobius newberryi TaxID=166745 RepID=UPI003B58BA8D
MVVQRERCSALVDAKAEFGPHPHSGVEFSRVRSPVEKIVFSASVSRRVSHKSRLFTDRSEMSSTSERSFEEMFRCSICLEVFSEPVSTPCGHNFCKRCICAAWAPEGPCTCPLCNRSYDRRPEISVNYFVLEMVSQFRRSSLPHMLEQRRLKVQEIQGCVELSDTEVHRERAVGLQAFTDLMQSVQSLQDRFLEELQEKQSRSHKRAQELVQQLEQEICELEKSSTEEERLSHSQDPLHFLQNCPALTPPAGLKEWSSLSFEPETCEGSAARALSELEKHLFEDFKHLPSRLELKRVQQFVVDVTLDPDTAHPRLVLSEDLKQVHCGDVKKKLPDSPLRFDTYVNVLGKQSFSSGRFYFEVHVKEKTDWDLGVAQESINRKGRITLRPKNGFWRIMLRNKDDYFTCADSWTRLPLQRAPQTVGVFVDYGEGLVSFYDADSADLLFSFSGCCFRKKLFPYFSPYMNNRGSNSAPLVLTAVETFRGHSDKQHFHLNQV